MTEHAIITRDLTLGHKQPLLTNINMEIQKGEFIGVFGPNGAGKSTFLRTLLGLLKPLTGEIQVLGETPHRGNAQIGYMPQMRRHITVANLTARAMLESTCQAAQYGLPITSKQQQADIAAVLNLVEATYYADRPFQQLSGGERQRIYLAQALLGHPSLLLLDEPLLNLDPHYQERFINLLHELQKTLNVTIIFTAHDPNPLLGVMSRVLFFARGRTVLGKTDEIITSETLTTLYDTPIEVMNIRGRLFVLGEGQNVLGEVLHHD